MIRRWRRPITRCASRRSHSNWLPAARSRPRPTMARFPARCCGFGKEARAINVINHSGYPNLIHWHGLDLPPFRMAPPRKDRRSSSRGILAALRVHTQTRRDALVSQPRDGDDRSRSPSTYSGEFGFLIVDPAPEVNPAWTTARSCSPPIIGKVHGSAWRSAQGAAA